MRSAYELVREEGINRLVIPPLVGLSVSTNAFTRGSHYAVAAIAGGTGLLLWWLIDPFFGALLAEGRENQGNAVGARGLLSAGLVGALALVLAVWKPSLRDKLIALGFGALVVGTVLYPAVGVYIGGAGLGIHMTVGAAFILVIAGLLAHPGAAK